MDAAGKLEELLKGAAAVCLSTDILELWLTNHIVADPSYLRVRITACTNLRSLCCVASSVTVQDIVYSILPVLTQLENLEFTLDERVTSNDARAIRLLLRTKVVPAYSQLRCVYVEVAGNGNIDVLGHLLELWPNVSGLHVHFLRGHFENTVRKCDGLWNGRTKLRRFGFTSEAPSTVHCYPRTNLFFDDCAGVCGNVLFGQGPQIWSCCLIGEPGETRGQKLLRGKHAIAVIRFTNDSTGDGMREAGFCNDWTGVKNLCLVLRKPFIDTQYTCAGAVYHGALVDFLRRFRGISGSGEYEHLTELNVNSFHCAADLDMTEVLCDSELTSLKALSVSPCGIRRVGALRRLALACPSLNDLDVRVYSSIPWCWGCEEDLDLSADDAADLSVGHNGGRLTFGGVPRFASLDFLSRCNVRELRVCTKHCLLPSELGDLLQTNEKLRCLTLGYDTLQFDVETFKNLKRLRCLRLLCLLTAASHGQPYVKGYMKALGSSLDQLEALHAHYTDTQGATDRMTWVRYLEEVEEAGQILDSLPVEPHLLCGSVVNDAPCGAICTTQTFIGLVKPKHRDLPTTF
ncbi:hypothetical protein HPB49_025580 [Dermacentor silvarum]|uniref:Uncharacterized protein n=1 Tax=Dermacentor silvarum TaxID=543639 RepID=A0ACB8DLD3_DERSI|nr:uncharacterized protein LOC125941499 [Dermacentor silvarum]KAH7971538.1 hypothetical protein HPB49_025580 [Dermacentor silvarum]